MSCFFKTVLKVCVSVPLMLIVCACGGIKYSSHKVKLDQFQEGKKAIIITSLSSKYKGWILNGTTPVDYTFSRADQNYSTLNTRHAYRINNAGFIPNTRYNVLMIDPGIYVLESVTYALGNATYETTMEGLNPGNEKFVYGGFKVDSGQIVYLGDIDFNMHTDKRNRVDVTITDNYEKAKQFLNKKYPELSSTPTKKDLLRQVVYYSDFI